MYHKFDDNLQKSILIFFIRYPAWRKKQVAKVMCHEFAYNS